MRYRELGHLLRFGTCQPVGKLLARNSSSNLSLSLSLPRAATAPWNWSVEFRHRWDGIAELPWMEKRPNEFFGGKQIPKTNLYHQNVFLSITNPELIGRAKFHYGIIALSKSPSHASPRRRRDEVRLSSEFGHCCSFLPAYESSFVQQKLQIAYCFTLISF